MEGILSLSNSPRPSYRLAPYDQRTALHVVNAIIFISTPIKLVYQVISNAPCQEAQMYEPNVTKDESLSRQLGSCSAVDADLAWPLAR
jgi:hypothetical protein